MGGRGGSGGAAAGAAARKGKGTNPVRTVNGLSMGERLFAAESDVSKMSPNTIWMENTNTPHALLKNSTGTAQVRGSKRDKYSLLEHVNTAVVHLSGIDRGDPKREVTKLNKQLSEIRSRGFDVQRISVGELESVAYIKRKLFSRGF